MENNENKKENNKKNNELIQVIRDFKRYSMIGMWASLLVSVVIKGMAGNGLNVSTEEWMQTVQILQFFSRLNTLFVYIFLFCTFYLLGKGK